MAEHPARDSRGNALRILRWAAFAACLGLFVNALAKSDLASAWGRIEAVGPKAVVIVVPFAAALAMDTWAWQGLLAALDRRASWWALFQVRLATEAVTNSAPGGPLWADAITPSLASKRTGVPAIDILAAATAKRWTVVRMHSTYVALTAAFGAGALVVVSQSLMKSQALLFIVMGASLGLMLLSIGIEVVAARGQVAGRISRLLGKARSKRLEAWVEKQHHHFARADVQLARLSKDKRAGVTACWRMLGLWVFEGLESVLIFKLLGAPLSVVEILSFDAALSVVRSTAMFAPAGIGVQDVGYLAVLQAFGVPDAASIGPAFLVMKRLKEAFWIAIGFAMLARSGGRSGASEADAKTAQGLPQDPPAST